MVHEPISPAPSSDGQPFFFKAPANSDSGCARSGVKGPLICGSSVDRSISMIWSYSAPSSALRLSANASARSAAAVRPVATR